MRIHFTRNALLLLCLLAAAIGNTGCLTTTLIGQAKKDRRPERVCQVQNAFIDSGNYLVVNFTATLNGRKKEEPCHIRLAIDTVKTLFQYHHNAPVGYSADTANENKYGISRIFNVSENPDLFPGHGVDVEFRRPVLKNGFYTAAIRDSLPGKIVVSTRKQDFGYGKRYPHLTPYGRLNARHIVLLYYPEQKLTIGSSTYDYMAISIEPSSKKQLHRYGLLPVSVALDAVSLPFQLVGAGILLLGYGSTK